MFVIKRQFSTFRGSFIFNGTCVTAVNMVFTTLNQLQHIPRYFDQFSTNILSSLLLGTRKYFVFDISNSIQNLQLSYVLRRHVGPQKDTKNIWHFITLNFGAIFKVASVTLVDSCH